MDDTETTRMIMLMITSKLFISRFNENVKNSHGLKYRISEVQILKWKVGQVEIWKFKFKLEPSELNWTNLLNEAIQEKKVT